MYCYMYFHWCTIAFLQWFEVTVHITYIIYKLSSINYYCIHVNAPLLSTDDCSVGGAFDESIGSSIGGAFSCSVGGGFSSVGGSFSLVGGAVSSVGGGFSSMGGAVSSVGGSV